jgi:hypothetical protein
MKDVLQEVISRLKSEKGGYCRITHKKGWLGLLEDGDLVFTPHELHQILKEVIDSDGMRPKGDKLLYMRKRDNFTVTGENIPCRPEEALERFITASNPENFFNQIPIGGGKESLDMGIKETDSRFTFIELKPWSSSNSPLYAVVESLKNLIEYRIICDRKIKIIEPFKEVNLIVLAPQAYYQTYGVSEGSEEKMNLIRKTLSDLGSEFRTNISLMSLPIDEKEFYDTCRKVCEKNRKAAGQEIITISGVDSIPELERSNWKLLVSSDTGSNR